MKNKVDVENANVVKRGIYAQVLKKIVAEGFCPFCEEHLFKHHRHPLVDKSKFWLITENAWPYKGSRYHYLFITRKHVETIEALSSATWTDLQKLYKKLVSGKNIRGATLMIRSGNTKITGASVNHLHAHLVSGGRRGKNTKPIKALVGFET